MIGSIAPKGFLQYDRAFAEAIQPYLETNIVCYAKARGGEALRRVVSRWPQLASLCLDDEFYVRDCVVPVHGDLNLSNVHLDRRDRTRIKVVDWEWAGIGLPQADLAALLKGVSPDVERRALEAHIQSDGRLPAEVHVRRYQWCKLQRGLLDAAFLSALELARPNPAGSRWASVIEKAASRALQAFGELR